MAVLVPDDRLLRFAVRKNFVYQAKRIILYETKCAKLFDKLCIISQQDADLIDTEKKIDCIPNGIDFSYFSKSSESAATFDLGFIRNMGYLPNIEAAQLLVKTIAVSYQKKFNLPLRTFW